MKRLVLFDKMIAFSSSKSVSINDRGYQTVTTKEALNKFLSVHGLGQIYQQDKKWYYSTDKIAFIGIPKNEWFKLTL